MLLNDLFIKLYLFDVDLKLRLAQPIDLKLRLTKFLALFLNQMIYVMFFLDFDNVSRFVYDNESNRFSFDFIVN